MSKYSRLNIFAREAIVRGNKNIAICPFHENGVLLKQILNTVYGIEEAMIIDNGLSKYNHKIKSVKDLAHMDLSEMVILLNSTNEKTNRELLEELQSLDSELCIRNILDPVYVYKPDKEKYFKILKDLFKVKRCVNHNLIRVGNNADGGYVMLDDFSKDMNSYSFGIGLEISYDLQMASLVHTHYMYDPTIEKVPYNHYNFKFFREGIAGKDAEREYFSMETFLRRNQDASNKNLILKMDVEGAEWEFIHDCSSELLDNFRQMTFELHNITDLTDEKTEALKKILITHVPVWIHGNVSMGAEYSDNYVVPTHIEVTYANKKRYRFQNSEFISPISLDYPNVGNVDLQLGNWGT